MPHKFVNTFETKQVKLNVCCPLLVKSTFVLVLSCKITIYSISQIFSSDSNDTSVVHETVLLANPMLAHVIDADDIPECMEHEFTAQVTTLLH